MEELDKCIAEFDRDSNIIDQSKSLTSVSDLSASQNHHQTGRDFSISTFLDDNNNNNNTNNNKFFGKINPAVEAAAAVAVATSQIMESTDVDARNFSIVQARDEDMFNSQLSPDLNNNSESILDANTMHGRICPPPALIMSASFDLNTTPITDGNGN